MRWMRICVYIGAVFNTVFYVGAIIANFVLTTPRPGYDWLAWDITTSEYNAGILFVAASAVGLAVDLYLLILPILAVSRLQLPLRRKIGVMIIFMGGIM